MINYDAATGSYDIYSPAQGLSGLRAQIATLTGVPTEKLRLHLYDVGAVLASAARFTRACCAHDGRAARWAGRSMGVIAL